MRSFYDEAILRLGLSPDQTTLPRIVFYYPDGVTVEGHKGITDFNENEISVRIGKNKVKIRGSSLRIVEIGEDQLFVRGKIDVVGAFDET